MSDRNILFVYAGNVQEFKQFLKKVPPEMTEGMDIRYVSKPGDERGFGYEVAFITYGTWYKHDWIHESIRRFQERGVGNKVIQFEGKGNDELS